jgi:predicted  nucleic acid-binding Zn-ribbon protein
MTEETKYLGHTPVKGDGYMEADRYRVKCRCLRCGHVYSRILKRLTDPDPACPKKACKEQIAAEQKAKEARHVETMIKTGQTPGHIGENVHVKAIDQTAEIVMQDYGMTDLKDNTRQGDSMAPALTPRQREMSKNFWGGSRVKDRKRDPTYQIGVQAQKKNMIDTAMSGGFLPNVAGSAPKDSRTGDTMLREIHGARYKPPVEIIYDTARQPKK